jgi:hypothetical protein
MSTNPGTTGIEITAKHSVLAWILIFFKPTFVVDGNASKQAWKSPTFVPAAPGQHQVQVHFSYLFLKTAGKAVITVTVNPGEVVKVGYKAPWIVFLPGKIKLG